MHHIASQVNDIEPNTFIGGTGISAASLASSTSLSIDDIKNLTIDANNNMSCYIGVNYTINTVGFGSNPLTYYLDLQGKVTSLGSQAFSITNNLKLALFPSITSIANQVFLQNAGNVRTIDVVSFPILTPIGLSSANDNCFTNTRLKYLYTNLNNQTNNAGSPDQDIITALSVRNIRYSNEFTSPSVVNNLAIEEAFATALKINWDANLHINDIDIYVVFVNGNYYNITETNSVFINNLTPSTSYTVKVIAVDVMGNVSESFSIPLTAITNANENYEAGAIYNYWNFNGNSKDIVNGNNGADTAISYTAGLIGNCANFTAGNTSVISVPDANSLTFGNATVDQPFSFVVLVKFTQVSNSILFSKSLSDREYEGFYTNNTLLFRVVSGGNFSNRIDYTVSFTPIVDTWYVLAFTYDGSGSITGLKVYSNASEILGTGLETGNYVAMSNTGAALNFGKFATLTNFSLNGFINLEAIFRKKLSSSEIIAITTRLLTENEHLV